MDVSITPHDLFGTVASSKYALIARSFCAHLQTVKGANENEPRLAVPSCHGAWSG